MEKVYRFQKTIEYGIKADSYELALNMRNDFDFVLNDCISREIQFERDHYIEADLIDYGWKVEDN